MGLRQRAAFMAARLTVPSSFISAAYLVESIAISATRPAASAWMPQP